MNTKIIWICALSFTLFVSNIVSASEIEQEKRDLFSGVWMAESGSKYKYENDQLICLSVTSNKTGWIGKSALENFRKIGGVWMADGAIRFGHTGDLLEWIKVRLQAKPDVLMIHYPKTRWGEATTREMKRVSR
ncbi:MAG: hypothetical protein GY859_28395 [Desulfobacterales bacterium]|nr:hypothetical protein [Desulfobacterales bacterium]